MSGVLGKHDDAFPPCPMVITTSDITLNENHVYRVKGTITPGVSEVLEAEGVTDFSFIPGTDRQGYLDRGRRVHLATEYYDDKTLDMDSIDPGDRGYIDAYDLFCRRNKWEPELTEEKVAHEALGYCGTLDRIGVLNGDVALLDIKSGGHYPSARLQLWAYALAAVDCGLIETLPEKQVVVQLMQDATYRLHYHGDRKDRLAWMNIIGAYNWKAAWLR